MTWRPGARGVCDRIEARRPDVVAVLKPDHLRDADLFVRWYGARAFGPSLFWPDDLPRRTELEPLQPDDELPGGLPALHDGRGKTETPVYLPEQRALIFADGMTAPEGVLRIWAAPGYEKRVLPASARCSTFRSSASRRSAGRQARRSTGTPLLECSAPC